MGGRSSTIPLSLRCYTTGSHIKLRRPRRTAAVLADRVQCRIGPDPSSTTAMADQGRRSFATIALPADSFSNAGASSPGATPLPSPAPPVEGCELTAVPTRSSTHTSPPSWSTSVLTRECPTALPSPSRVLARSKIAALRSSGIPGCRRRLSNHGPGRPSNERSPNNFNARAIRCCGSSRRRATRYRHESSRGDSRDVDPIDLTVESDHNDSEPTV